MIKIEIRDELIDWLEERSDGLSRGSCVEFAKEFLSFILMTGALTVEMPDLREPLETLFTVLACVDTAYETETGRTIEQDFSEELDQARAALAADKLHFSETHITESRKGKEL